MLRQHSQFICLSVIFVNLVFRTAKNYYFQMLLDEYKFVFKVKKIPQYIIDDILISSDSDGENSDEKNSDKQTSDKEICDKEN